jgi:hypothetical protein
MSIVRAARYTRVARMTGPRSAPRGRLDSAHTRWRSLALCICTAALAAGTSARAAAAQGPTVVYDTPDHNPQIVIFPAQLERLDSVHVRGFTRWSYATPPALDGAPGFLIDHKIIRLEVDCRAHTAVIASGVAYPADTLHRTHVLFGMKPLRGGRQSWNLPAPATPPYRAIATAMCRAAAPAAPHGEVPMRPAI